MHDEADRSEFADCRSEPAAFDVLYRQYFPRLYAYVAYRVGRAHDAEELVAETFLHAVEAYPRFEWRAQHSFAAWLFRIAHNLISNYYRDRRHSAEHVSLEELPEIAVQQGVPEELLARKELFAQLRALIATLSPRRQEVVTLKFFGELRNHEIAVILGLDERTVASHLCRGLDDLHRKYLAATVPASEERIL